MISGTAYGVVLNDRAQVERLADAFRASPYVRPPVAPVLYIKPRNCFRSSGSSVAVPAHLAEIEAAATLGLLFSRDVSGPDPIVADAIGAVCLALDLSEPHESFYRPALVERCRDGFLPLGDFAPVPQRMDGLEIVTVVDGAEVHRWSLSRLVRDVEALVRDIASFMTLAAGDLLLVGLPGDAPRVNADAAIEVRCSDLPTLTAMLEPSVQ